MLSGIRPFFIGINYYVSKNFKQIFYFAKNVKIMCLILLL